MYSISFMCELALFQDGMYPLAEEESGCDEDEGDEEEEIREEEEFESDESLVDSDSESDEKGLSFTLWGE